MTPDRDYTASHGAADPSPDTGPAAAPGADDGPRLRLDVVTIFPDYLQPLRLALPGRAAERGIVSIGVHDLRRWTRDVHRSVDDTPFGGGPGMVMLIEVGDAPEVTLPGDLPARAKERFEKIMADTPVKWTRSPVQMP